LLLLHVSRLPAAAAGSFMTGYRGRGDADAVVLLAITQYFSKIDQDGLVEEY